MKHLTAGRPREFDREKALAKARDIFWSRGYEGVSMGDLVALLGIASARIYAAFGSKEELFREAVALYEATEGGFADRALKEEKTVYRTIERILREAIETYTRQGKPQGCMVVTAATNCTENNRKIMEWLTAHRRNRTASIIARLKKAVENGELRPDTNPEALGDHFAVILHGLSVQARDGVPKGRLLALVPIALRAIPLN